MASNKRAWIIGIIIAVLVISCIVFNILLWKSGVKLDIRDIIRPIGPPIIDPPPIIRPILPT